MPKGLDAGLVELIERVVDACTQDAVALTQDLLDAMGPRPFGHKDATLQEQLEWFLAVRDDPLFWQQWYAENVPLVGPEAADAYAVREQTRLHVALAKRGGWDGDPADLQRAIGDGANSVRFVAMEKALAQSKKAIAKAEKLDQKPKARVLEPLVQLDALQLLQGVA